MRFRVVLVEAVMQDRRRQGVPGIKDHLGRGSLSNLLSTFPFQDDERSSFIKSVFLT